MKNSDCLLLKENNWYNIKRKKYHHHCHDAYSKSIRYDFDDFVIKIKLIVKCLWLISK